MEWKPIETAPKDGTFVLTYDSEYGFLVCSFTAGFWFPFDGDYPIDPTHWMPFPEPPPDETK